MTVFCFVFVGVFWLVFFQINEQRKVVPFTESSTKFQVTLPGTSLEELKGTLGMITLTSFITMPTQMNRLSENTALAWPSLQRYTENKVAQISKRCLM